MRPRRIGQYPSRPPPALTPKVDCWWNFFWILIALTFIGLFIAILARPYPAYPYYRDASPLGKKDGQPRQNCTIGEVYDNDLDICGPNIVTPVPISYELMDGSVKPCDSFFRHMSGKWIDTHVNENRGFTYVYRKNQKEIHDIVRDPSSGPVYNFYRSCIDTLIHGRHRILDQSQVKHVKNHILGALKSHADLPVVFARLARYGFASPFTLSIEAHPTKLQMVPLVQADWVDFLEEYMTDPPFKGSYVEYVQSERFMRDMTNMGALLDSSPPNFWKLYLRELNGYQMEEEMDAMNQPLWLVDKEYMMGILHEGLQKHSVEIWRDYVQRSIDDATLQFFPDLPADSYFRIHNPVSPKYLRHRLKRDSVPVTDRACLSITHKLLPGLIGNLFLAKTMPNHHQVKLQVTKIVENVRDAFANMIQNTSWLSVETRNEATEKIRSIIVRSVVPTYYETEPFADRLTPDNYLRNLNIIRQYFATRNFELWTKTEPNRDIIQRFGAPLTEVNAFYSPVSNTITIFAGILNKPFYSEEYSEVALYATIGMIAGHELAHALDNTGRLFDKDGSLSRKEPWSAEEYAEFKRRSQAIIDEYGAPMGCENAQYGEQTLGEDLADINGLMAAYRAYFNKERPLGEKQWFFQIFGQMWAESYDQETLCGRVMDDEHAIAMFRVDKTLRQLHAFREAFGCNVGDKMVNEHAVVVYGE